MKIRLSTIPYEGLNLELKLPLEALNSRLSEGSSKEILVLEAPEVSVSIKPIHGTAFEAKGTITARLRQPCATCAEDVERSLMVPFIWALELARDDSPEIFDDVGFIAYQGEHVDLEEHLQEALILQLSPFWRPERGKNQACTACGKTCLVGNSSKRKDSGTKLGDLLKKARVLIF